jgi:hypothetical protein
MPGIPVQSPVTDLLSVSRAQIAELARKLVMGEGRFTRKRLFGELERALDWVALVDVFRKPSLQASNCVYARVG